MTHVVPITKAFKDDARQQYEEWLVWHTLQEELCSAKIDKWFIDQRNNTLELVNTLSSVYSDTKKLSTSIDSLLSAPVLPIKKFKSLDNFRFESYTFPVEIRNFLKTDDPLAAKINTISTIETKEFKKILKDTTNTGTKGGGQSVFNLFRINLPFVMLNEGALKELMDYNLKLSDQIEESIVSRIKYELIEGMKNFESIPEIRDRIMSAYDKPVTIVVPPRVNENGDVTRKGYSYEMDSKVWSTIVARTEMTRAFVAGRLEAYRQSRVVARVEFATAGDERVCDQCGPLDATDYTLEESYGMIPVHPTCRCTFIPIVDDALFDEIISEASDNIESEYATEG